MIKMYVTRAYRQRSTIVTSLPGNVRGRMGLRPGDYVLWQVDDDSHFVQLSKVGYGVSGNAKRRRNRDRKD